MQFVCPICQKEYDTLRSICTHIKKSHNSNSRDVLFGVYPELFRNCLYCGVKIKHFVSDSQSRKCCNKEHDRLRRKGLKQSQETIDKRVNNTDQKKKEEKRKLSMMEKYGTLYCPLDPEGRSLKISKSHKNRKHTKEHHKKVIETKKKNDTLNHKTSAKNKISNSLLEYYQNDNIDHSVNIPIEGKGGKHKQGTYNGIYYRSSYELLFLILCEKYNVKVESAATKEFRIRYEHNGKKHYYYPDFYLPDYDIICEIKPISLLNYNQNDCKIHEGMLKYAYWLVTEEELEENIFYEHLLFVK